MRRRSIAMRKVTDGIIRVLSSLAALLGIAALTWILYEVVSRGITAIDWKFFTELPTPPGIEGGGVSNAIVGTFSMIAVAVILGVPLGLLAGVYLSEFGRHTRFGELVRFANNVMMGIPSIIVGLFVYTLMVLRMGHFSGWAGAVSLAIIMLPVMGRTTEDMLTLVPNSLRESALALGAPRWKVTLGIVFRAAKSGLITGSLLAIARVSGETAPLLFTALNSPYWAKSFDGPIPNLTVTIFNYAMSPYADWQRIAWGASLLIMLSVLVMTVVARTIFQEAK